MSHPYVPISSSTAVITSAEAELRPPAGITTDPLAYYGFSEGWLFHALRRVYEFGGLQENWDREGGEIIGAGAQAAARGALLRLGRVEQCSPTVYPLNSGGILIEWKKDDTASANLFQIEFAPDGSAELTVTRDGRIIFDHPLSEHQIPQVVDNL